MIAKIIASIGLVTAIGTGYYAADQHFLTSEKADILYVRQDVFEKTANQQRIWQLQDRIAAIKAQAQGRQLTPFENKQIKDLQRDIERLR